MMKVWGPSITPTGYGRIGREMRHAQKTGWCRINVHKRHSAQRRENVKMLRLDLGREGRIGEYQRAESFTAENSDGARRGGIHSHGFHESGVRTGKGSTDEAPLMEGEEMGTNETAGTNMTWRCCEEKRSSRNGHKGHTRPESDSTRVSLALVGHPAVFGVTPGACILRADG